jgi:HAD superfamily hydrolase (TIGR01509 family)
VTAGTGELKAVFFDFAGTLFSDRDLRDAHLEQLRRVAELVCADADDSAVRSAYRQGMGVAYHRIAGRSWYSHRELFGAAFAAMAESLGGQLSPAMVEELVDRQYRSTIDHAIPRPDCLSTLRALRAAGLHLQVVSNIDDEQLLPMLDRMEIAPLLDCWTSSDEAKSCKPDSRIFECALKKADLPAEQVLFVGDSVGHDIVGPAAVGMQTALLTAGGKPAQGQAAPDFTINALSDVVPIVVTA